MGAAGEIVDELSARLHMQHFHISIFLALGKLQKNKGKKKIMAAAAAIYRGVR